MDISAQYLLDYLIDDLRHRFTLFTPHLHLLGEHRRGEKPDGSILGLEAVEAAAADPNRALIVANLANVDVVGHIENRAAVIKAVESVDAALGRIVAAARRNKATLLVTADHGTVEDWLYPDGKVDTGHTKSPVPFIFADFAEPAIPGVSLRDDGELSDVAPTILDLLGLPKPAEMTGESLLEFLK